jgi:putative transposase
MTPVKRTVNTFEASSLMGVTIRTVQRMVKDGRIRASLANNQQGGKSGESFSIAITDLPREAQLRYAAMMDRTDNGQADLAGYRERFGQEGIDQLMDRLDAVREMKLFEETGTGSLVKKRAEVAKLLGVSPRTLYSYEQAYKQHGISGIMNATKRKDKGAPRTLCRMAQDFVHSETCLSTRPQNRAVYANLKKVAARLGEDACRVCPYNEGSLFRAELVQMGKLGSREEACEHEKDGLVVPSHYSTVDRYIKQIPAGVKALGRFGAKYWEDKYMPKALRAKPEKVNEVWFGDHHVFDVMVTGPDGRAVRPWLTAWMDARSGALVGWAISLNPNSDTITESLTRGIGRTAGSPFWGAPLMIYIDNGKDYRARRMEGEKLQEYSVGRLNVDFTAENALLKTLGIGVTHAIPYRAWSKTIERAFGTIERRFIQGALPGWCGHRSDAKPEDLARQIRDKELLSYEEFCAYFVNTVLPGYHGMTDEEGLSPLSIYTASEKARGDEAISWAVLSMAKENRETRRVGTTGIRFAGKVYHDPALAEHIGETVTILYNRRETESISVMRGQEYICEAYEVERMKLVGEDPEVLARHMQHQKDTKRAAREALRLPAERLHMLHDLVMEKPDLDTAHTITSVVHERAYRERQAARKRADRLHGIKSAEEKQAESAIRDGLAQRGMELWLKAKEA